MNPSVSTEAVRQATGREWDYWFALLADSEAAAAEGTPAFGATEDAAAERPPELDHRALVSVLEAEHPELSGWWRQMIVVEYEKEVGRRVTGETADSGFQVGVQRTLSASSDAIWATLSAPDGVRAWLGTDDVALEEGARYGGEDGPSGEVRVVVPRDRVRLTWQPGDWPRPSTLQVRLTEKESDKTVVSIHHEHLPDEAAREAMRVRWKEVLSALADRVES